MSAQSLRNRVLELGAEYNALVLSISEITDGLHRTLLESGIEAAATLLESRSVLCSRLVERGEALKPLVRDAVQADSDTGLQDMLARVRANLDSLHEKQRACEAVLADRMDRCRADLAALRQQSGACIAYQGGRREQDARFLDSIR